MNRMDYAKGGGGKKKKILLMNLRTVGKNQDKPNFKPNVHWQLVGL